MDIFEINLHAIAAKDPPLAERIRGAAAEGVTLEETRSGDRTFRYRGRYFHSRYDPWKEAGSQAKDILGRNSDWVILFGLGCGYLLRTLLREGKSKVIVYEPSVEILKGVLKGMDLSEALGGEDVRVCLDVDSLVNFVRSAVEGIDDIVGYQTIPYRQAFAGELDLYMRKVRNAHTTNAVGVSTEINSFLKWNENYCSNVRVFIEYPPIDVLKDALKGVPMIIAGAGPSLKKNANLLKEAKGKSVIVSAITAYKPLLKYGVVPDFVIAAEKVDLPEYFTYGEEDGKIRLILGDVSHPEMFRRAVKGKFLYYNAFNRLSFEQARFWGTDYFPSSGGSVTTSAFDMGFMFGCDPIIFVGQDLAYGDDGRTHAPGGVYIEQNTRFDDAAGKASIEESYVSREMTVKEGKSTVDLLWLKGLDGKPVASRFDWVTFHQWFEKRMQDVRGEGYTQKVINATEGGAYIEGMEHMTLKDALSRHLGGDVPLEEIISSRESSRPLADVESARSSFKKMASGFRAIYRLSLEIVRETETLSGHFARMGMSAELLKNVRRIRRLEERLFERTRDAVFIWALLSAHTYRLKEFLREGGGGGAADKFGRDVEMTAATYRKVAETCKAFLPFLSGALKALEDAAPAGGAIGGDARPYGGKGGCEKENCCGQCRH